MKVTETKSSSPSLTDRMKTYEQVETKYLMRRTPVIIRLDGKAFKNWTTKNLERPFDPRLPEIMKETVSFLMNEVQGCVFGYSQSDEISLFLRDYDNLNTESWFSNSVQKIASVAASLATGKFNEYASQYEFSTAFFDARVFNLPKDEVVNYFIYRQHDGIRNSVSMYANHVLGHKEIQGKNSIAMKELLAEKGKSWDDLPNVFRHGVAIRKDESTFTTQLPLFKDDRSYIEELVYVKPE
jgi:tRNA(His) 5'-end guanylyltransferase